MVELPNDVGERNLLSIGCWIYGFAFGAFLVVLSFLFTYRRYRKSWVYISLSMSVAMAGITTVCGTIVTMDPTQNPNVSALCSPDEISPNQKP